ncbi:penicillin acylase family protein [Gluconacetobacter dulcium]|uniref:penicillin acylase family protein n=1 Tax=Gluconacetobacter dulcium TaxID=2729096 RepID=UPI0021809F68|nr:penicillin acylase family protein [Gluconacetobacter dulcium]
MCAPGPSRALFFADGYLVAQDQLWELDFGHHRSLGRLAELFSAAFVPSETANRLILFRGDDEQELAAFPPPGARVRTGLARISHTLMWGGLTKRRQLVPSGSDLFS